MSIVVVFGAFGGAIRGKLNTDALEKAAAQIGGVAATYQTPRLNSSYLIERIEELRFEKGLPVEGVVAVAGSRSTIEEPLQRAMESAGLDPNRLVVVNVKEQCAWV